MSQQETHGVLNSHVIRRRVTSWVLYTGARCWAIAVYWNTDWNTADLTSSLAETSLVKLGTPAVTSQSGAFDNSFKGFSRIR